MNPLSIEDTLYQIDELLNDADSTNDTKKAIGDIIIAISHLKDIVAQSLELTAKNESVHCTIQAKAHDRERNRATGGCANAAHSGHHTNESESQDAARGA